MLKLNFQKDKVVRGKTSFFVIGPFCTPLLFVLIWLLTGHFCMEMLQLQLLYFQLKQVVRRTTGVCSIGIVLFKASLKSVSRKSLLFIKIENRLFV